MDKNMAEHFDFKTKDIPSELSCIEFFMYRVVRVFAKTVTCIRVF